MSTELQQQADRLVLSIRSIAAHAERNGAIRIVKFSDDQNGMLCVRADFGNGVIALIARLRCSGFDVGRGDLINPRTGQIEGRL